MAKDDFQFELRANKEHEDYYLRKPDGTLLAVLNYKNWYSSEARFAIGDWQLQAGTDNFWNSSYSVKELTTSLSVAVITFNWKGEAIINFTPPQQEATVFILKSAGLLNYRFTLLRDEELIMTISPDFTFKKMSYEYEVKGKSFFESAALTHLLTIVSIYISNLLMATIVAAV